MVARQDGAVRTLAQKTQITNRQDGQLRTVTQKEPTTGFTHSYGVIIG